MSLRLKFILIGFLVSAAVAVVGATQLHRLQQEAFAAETERRVQMLSDVGEAMGGYIWAHAAPATAAYTKSVVLETMAPAFAIRALFDGFHRLAPEYSFRSPSLNPTRREDLATDLEAGLIRRFDG